MLTVRTGKDCLLVAVNAKDEALLRYNGDHLDVKAFKLVLTRKSVMIEMRPIPITCACCSISRAVKPTPKGEPRTPTGWKKLVDAAYCPECWRKQYILRAITMPVASPLDCSWDELRKALRTMWAQTTAASNWMMTELFARDVRKGSEEKMPPMARVYLYPEARARFPGLPSQTVSSLEQSVQRKYRAVRYAVVWTAAASLPTHRYPTPFPVPKQAWAATIEAEQAIVSMRIGDARHRLRLKRGPQFRRQMAAFRQIAQGEAIAGELAIYDHDGVLVKMAAWLPREEEKEARADVLTVRTGKDCLLVAVNTKDEELWRYNGDHVRRWAGEHRTQLQRWNEDQKYEQQPVPAFARRRETAVRKFRDRMNSATHEIAAQLAGYASRRHFAQVRYDDSDHSYMGDGFPWYRLRSLIADKLVARGIVLETSAQPEQERVGPLAED